MPLKKTVLKNLIINLDWDGILSWWNEERSAQRVVMSLLFDNDPLVKWRTIQALGRICAVKAESDPEWFKGIIRHFLWGMNDESGNLIWIAPEALSEIFLRVPGVIDEYSSLVIVNYDLEPFEAGVHLFMARISALNSVVLKDFSHVLLESLKDNDPKIRMYAAVALKNIDPSFEAQFMHLESDAESVEVFDFADSKLKKDTVGSLVTALRQNKIDNFIGLN